MKKLKILSLMLALLFAVCTFSSCSKFEYDNSTIVAKVTAIDGQKVTLLVGEMSMDENMMQGGFGENMTPPTADGSIPEIPEGELGEMPTLPEGETMPEGEAPQLPEGETMPQMPEGGMQVPDGELPEGMGEGMQMPFTAGEDTITLTLNEETVKTLSVDSIVQITFGDNGNVVSLTVLGGNGNMMPGGGAGGNMDNMTPPTDESADESQSENTNS